MGSRQEEEAGVGLEVQLPSPGAVVRARSRAYLVESVEPSDQGADPEDPDEYRGFTHPVSWVPLEARWPAPEGAGPAADHRPAPERLHLMAGPAR